MIFSPDLLDTLFPIEHQRRYMAMFQKRGGFTRRRAECFVRLWGYLVLKQAAELQNRLPAPLQELYPPEGLVACTHREAADLFYHNQERGSDRAAGMMIDRFVDLGLMEKQFDGQALALQIRALPELLTGAQPTTTLEFYADHFNPRTDAIPIANLFTQSYGELVKDNAATSYKISRSLRTWTTQYSGGIRVLRRVDNRNPIGAYILYPVIAESECHFFQPPSKSFYLTNDALEDPFKMAMPGDPHCTSINIRFWVIDPNYMNAATLAQLLQDCQTTLRQMQQDFPELCDLYSVIVHPMYEELRRVLGFARMCADNQRSYAWIYLAVDRFLELDIPTALSTLKFIPTPGKEPDAK
jgi:hypothetical protein